jgi:ferredoxin
MKVSVDLELCCGHGRCYALCPELFKEDEAGHCVLERSAVPEDLERRARVAADNCPELAILIED